MKTSFILCITLLASSIGSWAQDTPTPRTPFDSRPKKTGEETQAKAIDAAKSVLAQVPDGVKNKAKELLTSPATADLREKALQAVQAARQHTATQPPAPSRAVAVVETPPPPAGPLPKLLQPLADEAPKATKGQILITAQKNAFFDANRGYGLYTGTVKARHPQMYIECEELEIYMAKQDGILSSSKPKPTAAKDADIIAPVKKAGTASSGIEKAYARGPMVTIEKIAEEGELQIGRCKDLYYDGKTGGTTLRGWPQVQAGNRLHQATEPSCVMIIDQKGKLTTTGGHRTIILQGEGAAPGSGSAPVTPAPALQ